MKKISVLTLVALGAFSVLAAAQDQKHHSNMTISSRNPDSDNCQEHMNMYSDEMPAVARSEETVTYPNQPLKVSASRNGGIHVVNWDKQEFSVKICRQVSARNEAKAKQVLEGIRLTGQGNNISVEGPERSDNDEYAWSTVLLIHAPVGSTMDLTAQNGGISLNRVASNVTAHTTNGGISLKETTGKIDVEARNGGISIKDCGGDVKATVQNGGLSIDLAEAWTGAGLEARSHNGGVVVSIPKNFQSSLEVASSGHSSVICQSSACDGGQRTWDDNGRIFKIGSSSPVIRASTVNGGIVIKDRGRKMGEL
jgi:DUF4097 and DUF4098 domain-containing protein YvlB